jgi:hypothetical protein
MSRTLHHLLAATAGALLVIAAVPAATAAPPVERGVIDDEFSGTEENYCEIEGFTVDFHALVTGSYTLKGRGDLLFYAEHIRVVNTLSNPETGESVHFVERTNDKDLKITVNGDGTYDVLVLARGASTLYGTSGKAIARNPGQVRFVLTFDDNGTPTDFFDDTEIGFEVVKESTGRSDDYCGPIHAEIG